jgi:uncharacterized protein (DUF2147 family)
MKRLLIALGALCALAAPASAEARNGLEGRWKNGKTEIVIRPCGGSLCGNVTKASPKQQAKAQRGSGTRLLGSRVIDNIQPAGPGTYKADVYLPDRDMTTRGTIRQVNANRLNVRGCLYMFLCKATNWDRVGR